MLREIKFKAWDKKTKKMMFSGFHILGEVTAFSQIEGYLSKNRCGAESTIERWNDVELMQYVGIKDKTGKDIYEEHICRILYTDWPSQGAEKNGRYSMSLEDYKKSISSIMVVKFFPPSFRLCRSNDTDTCYSMNPGKHGEIEIIGNTYENPELA